MVGYWRNEPERVREYQERMAIADREHQERLAIADEEGKNVVELRRRYRALEPGSVEWEAILNGNAKPEYIADRLGEMLRHLIRAVAQKTDYSTNLFEAMRLWKSVWELVERCKEPLSWHDLFEEAIKGLREDGDPDRDSLDEAYREVARTGMSLYIDGMGQGGFGSVKYDRFMDALRWLEEHRDRQRKERKRERALGQEAIVWKGRSEHGDEVIFHIAARNCLVMVTQVSEVRRGKVVEYRARQTQGCSIAAAKLSQEEAISLAELILTKYTADK
jgi:hypothetical protein